MEEIFGIDLNKNSINVVLSVIVPIYNVAKFLPKCIDSILNQTYEHMEIILVDDGSTDESSQICDKYAKIDKRIKIIHKMNQGLVRARKDGLEVAKGEYIAFVDGDDWIDSGMYLELLRVMKDSNADFLDTSYFCDREDDFEVERKSEGVYELVPTIRHRILKTLINSDDFIKITPSIWSKIFKADVIKDAYAKVPDNMQYGEDVISLIYCLLRSDKMIQIDEAFYHYNYREDSMSHFKSVSYLRKELVLWNYCGNIILSHDPLMLQENIDCCLFRRLYSSLKHLLSNEFDTIQYYSFPYIKKLYGKKIVLYGAGRVGRDYLSQITKYENCEIVCWVDKNYEQIQFSYRKVIGVEDFLGKMYDYVLIAVEQKETAKEIKINLLKKGIPEDKILWYEPATPF